MHESPAVETLDPWSLEIMVPMECGNSRNRNIKFRLGGVENLRGHLYDWALNGIDTKQRLPIQGVKTAVFFCTAKTKTSCS
jgi:hypothetical protein